MDRYDQFHTESKSMRRKYKRQIMNVSAYKMCVAFIDTVIHSDYMLVGSVSVHSWTPFCVSQAQWMCIRPSPWIASLQRWAITGTSLIYLFWYSYQAWRSYVVTSNIIGEALAGTFSLEWSFLGTPQTLLYRQWKMAEVGHSKCPRGMEVISGLLILLLRYFQA